MSEDDEREDDEEETMETESEEEEYDAEEDAEDEEDAVVMSQKDVKAANVAALLSGTLETSVKPYVRGLTVEDPAVVLRRAFKSPFPNAPNRSGTWVDFRRARALTGCLRNFSKVGTARARERWTRECRTRCDAMGVVVLDD